MLPSRTWSANSDSNARGSPIFPDLKSGKIGEPRAFESLFALQVRDGNIRTRRELGGGTLWDLGVYCINAVRHLFQEEPFEVFAYSSSTDDPRFKEIDE